MGFGVRKSIFLERVVSVACVILVAILASTPLRADDAAAVYAKYADQIEKVEQRGRLIFEKDRAAWVATDHFLAESEIASDGAVLGWVTEETDDGQLAVSFLALEDDKIGVRYAVSTRNGVVLPETSEVLSPVRSMTDKQRLMFNARSIALSSEFVACASNYNIVVLESDEPTKFLVYLLPAQTNLNQVPLGGHHRFLIEAEPDLSGTTENAILDQRAFTKSCLVLPKLPGAIAVFTTHITAPYPEEPHIYYSLLTEIEFLVLTLDSETVWRVNNGKIEASDLKLN